MKTTYVLSAVLIFIILYAGYQFFHSPTSGTSVNSVPISNDSNVLSETDRAAEATDPSAPPSGDTNTSTESASVVRGPEKSFIVSISSREISLAERITLPLTGSAPTEDVLHSIPIEEIRRGCLRRDCIPSVDNPQFITTEEANSILPEDTIGIGLIYKGSVRFYPFNMLVTREIVNDVVAGDPLLVTYCPLCGTGIVFSRSVQGEIYEFGVSGMLWQSNLLMYNRASKLEDRNLWSQVLGEAVVGKRVGTKLAIIPSNVVRYTDWRVSHPDSEVLNTGRIGDPYGGNYYEVARNFAPNFNENSSPLDPSVYVFGIESDGKFKAYPRETLPEGETTDSFAGLQITIYKTPSGEVTITDSSGSEIPVVTGFWFSWVAAHPETELWSL